jgi:hypothetical protein
MVLHHLRSELVSPSLQTKSLFELLHQVLVSSLFQVLQIRNGSMAVDEVPEVAAS